MSFWILEVFIMRYASLACGASVALTLALLPLGSRADEAVPADRALIVVRVPATAAVWFENTPTTRTGSERRFLSPALEPGKSYTYAVKARWDEGGTPKQVVRSVVVAPGKRSVVDFNPAGATACTKE